MAQNFRVSVNEKTYGNLKLLKGKMLKTLKVNNFLFNFALFSYWKRVIFKHLTLVLNSTFLTMKPLIWKLEIIIHNDFRIDILL